MTNITNYLKKYINTYYAKGKRKGSYPCDLIDELWSIRQKNTDYTLMTIFNYKICEFDLLISIVEYNYIEYYNFKSLDLIINTSINQLEKLIKE